MSVGSVSWRHLKGVFPEFAISQKEIQKIKIKRKQNFLQKKTFVSASLTIILNKLDCFSKVLKAIPILMSKAKSLPM